MELRHAYMVIADISGYTRFLMLHTTSLLHAEFIITELMEAVISRSEHPLTIAKLEGDAIFLYALADDTPEVARDILKQAAGFFEAFSEKERELIACNTCGCQACRSIDKLQLKVIIHKGEVAVKKVREFMELAGPDVILIHRLLKNSVTVKEYLLMTETFFESSGGLPEYEVDSRTEHADGVGDVNVKIYYPVHDDKLPEQPGPTLPLPGTKEGLLYERMNNYGDRRLNGIEPERNFSSLSKLDINFLSRMGFRFGKILPKIIVCIQRALTKQQ
jgi:hypothetical protein